MTAPTILEYSRTYPVDPERAYDWILPIPLEQIFARRYGPLPPIKGTDIDGGGVWGTAGQTRTIRLADGGTMRESLTRVDRPWSFGYRIDNVTGPMRPLVATLDGLWSVEPAGNGARVTWRWTVQPTNAWTARVMPVFGRLWQGYARQAFEEIEKGLV
ncbi:SRPBCC family protein [Nocardioides sp. InS609-2]|uniref:SRPBCC family protein n=1 Tax=Nocardioides sp. InS609-2 TaxID=2760705 RepID=UPI0020C1604F|nr:SRPBCC family protein [Nocardioides sp. InS609-2]